MAEIKNFRSTPAQLPWWTWILPIVILHIGTELSLNFKYTQGVADHYLPTALSIILVNWWGPLRVIPAAYINATLSTGLWGIDDQLQWPIYSLPETMYTFLSWFFFTYLAKGKYWMPDVKNLALFIGFGMFIPVFVEITSLEFMLVYFGEHSLNDFWLYFARNSLGEFTSSIGLGLPLLYYGTPFLQRLNLLLYPPEQQLQVKKVPRSNRIELLIIYIVLFCLTLFVPFNQFWFVYGLFCLYTAIRYGFGVAVITNYYIFVITYIIPALQLGWTTMPTAEVINIFLGMLLLYIFAAITGRVINDLKSVEYKLQTKNDELEHTNKELDRFVYSVSHDLSAPLKSILGLVNVSRIDHTAPKESYISKIEFSVKKLEAFISEILDYSRNKRLDINPEKIKLKELCLEILDNLKFMEGYQRITIDLDHFQYDEIYADKSRIKIILNNLLSNAIKFHDKTKVEPCYIKVSSCFSDNAIVIEVEDNGQGIRSEFQHRIFDMFFRGTENEKGSGLGLYIAKEAVERLNGSISVTSNYGVGSKFLVRVPLR